MLERACARDLEALWLMRRLAPDYRTIAAFRHDNPEAIVRTSAAFVQFCREQGLIGGRMVALDGTKPPKGEGRSSAIGPCVQYSSCGERVRRRETDRAGAL